MALTEQNTRKVANLARIGLSDDEVTHYTSELNGILGWIDQLQEVHTEGVEQMTSVAPVTLPMRKDEVSDGGIQQAVLKNAPASEYGCFAVPKVIE
jgi:aspartyl-tRNA(Asn)/glutamyl-tRNA(Gln) amidotransferase subunit C